MISRNKKEKFKGIYSKQQLILTINTKILKLKFLFFAWKIVGIASIRFYSPANMTIATLLKRLCSRYAIIQALTLFTIMMIHKYAKIIK